MPLPVRHLPVVQNWDCHSCSNCCRELQVHVSDEERARIEALNWDGTDLKDTRRFVRHGPFWRRRTRLGQRADGACVFLGKDNRCRIHERAGADAKPLACRLFPYVLAPAGNHWRGGVRFSCPSAAANRGRPLVAHEHELIQSARLVERSQDFKAEAVRPPLLQRGQTADWPDVLRFVDALTTLLEDRADRVELRLRKCLALVALCRQARFDGITGGRLVDFLNVVRQGVAAEVPTDPASLPRPGWTGRVLFRQLLALYTRKDHGELRGPATRSRLTLLRAGWRFARGKGRVPKMNALIPDVSFEEVEANGGPLPPAAEAVLERYYLVKVAALQFCGPLNFGLGVWDGFESLALTFPAALWLARSLRDRPRDEAITLALQIVDDHFAYNPVLKSRRVRFAQRTITRRGDLEKLVGWYGR